MSNFLSTFPASNSNGSGIKRSKSKNGPDDQFSTSPASSFPKYHGMASLATSEFQNFRKSSTQGIHMRNGTVLTRRSILKMDQFYKGINLDFDNLFVGAPNFRQTEMNIFGVAQPTTVGLATILSLLECAPQNLT